YKEARESSYWIKLLEKSNYLTNTESQSLLGDLTEILKIIGKIQITIR
ncbi:four helix bundle protein, partial [Candidatus Shapirobacteria bacterium CG10_big_fil_rev_8_21_14_0_10_36_6]